MLDKREKPCTTHHHACDCREAKFTALENELAYYSELCTSQQAQIGELRAVKAKLEARIMTQMLEGEDEAPR